MFSVRLLHVAVLTAALSTLQHPPPSVPVFHTRTVSLSVSHGLVRAKLGAARISLEHGSWTRARWVLDFGDPRSAFALDRESLEKLGLHIWHLTARYVRVKLSESPVDLS